MSSCEAEKDYISDEVNNKDYQIKKISFSELKSNQKAFQKLKDVFVKKNPYLQRGVYNEDYGVFIDTTNIVIVENGEKHSITFQIIDEEYSNKLENLVLNSKEDGSYIAYITEYLLTIQELNKLAKGESLPSKSPSAITKIESLSRIIISGNGAGCVSFNTYFIHLCRDRDGNLMQDNGDVGNGCVGMSFDYEYTVLSINSSCLEEFSNASSGGSNSSGINGTNGSNGGMGGGGFGNPNNSNPILTTPVISQNMTEIKILSLLNLEQSNWWWFTATKVIKDEIIAFFNSSGFTDENSGFSKQMINQMMQNPTVFTSITPFLIEKNIDDTLLDPCTKGILNKLKQNHAIAKIIARFDNPNTAFSININEGTTTTINGIRLGETSASSTPLTYNVTLNDTYFNDNGSTNLIKAQALIHEIMHALIYSVIYNPQGPNNIDSTDFSAIWNAYVNHEFGNGNDEHHEFLGNKYVTIIASALQEYDTGIPVPDGQNLSQLYTDLAWVGLIKVPSTEPTHFDNIITPADKLRFYGRWNAEINRSAFNGVNPSSNNPCLN